MAFKARIIADLQVVCEESGSVQFRDSYSGRSMYGNRCVGIVGSWTDCQAVIAELIKSLHWNNLDPSMSDFDRAVEILILGQQQDSMGCDMIIYWPDLTIEE